MMKTTSVQERDFEIVSSAVDGVDDPSPFLS